MTDAPREASILWPDPKTGPWCVTVWWRVQYGVATPVGLAITSWTGGNVTQAAGRGVLPPGDADLAFPKIEGQLLRALPMTEILDRTRTLIQLELYAEEARFSSPQEIVEAMTDPAFACWARTHFPGLADVSQPSPTSPLFDKRGTRDLGDGHYRAVAEVYAQAVRDGAPPTAAVAAAWQIEKSSAGKQVARARERGFLPPSTGRGRVGPIVPVSQEEQSKRGRKP